LASIREADVVDPTEATDAEILAAVEAWARARGYYYDALDRQASDRVLGWHITIRPDFSIHVWHRHGVADNDVSKSRHPTPLVSLAWALCVEADERVDCGRCPTCKGAGNLEKWRMGVGKEADAECPDCNGTGRDTREAARLVLDVAPRPIDADVRRIFFGDNPPATVKLGGCGEEVSTTHSPGDQASIDALTVHAERLMEGGRQCGACDGQGEVRPTDIDHEPLERLRDGTAVKWRVTKFAPVDDETPRNLRVRCPSCKGSRKMPAPLGELLALYLHRWSTGDGREGTAEAVRRLQRETDQFAQEYDYVPRSPESARSMI
jgi:hypothetical protein